MIFRKVDSNLKVETYLKDGDKVILFSQWDEILKKIGTMLIKQKIKLVYCSGTVYQKKRAINNFCKNIFK